MAISGGSDGGFIRASIYHDHVDSVAAWQARYSPWRPHWTCKPHASQTVIGGVRGDAAPEPATGQVSRPQVASSSAASLEAPAERSVAKDLYVHGLGGIKGAFAMGTESMVVTC